jgi:hypothetical protein
VENNPKPWPLNPAWVEEVFAIISVIGTRQMVFINKPEIYFRAIFESETLCCLEFLKAMQDVPFIDRHDAVKAFSLGLFTGKRQEFIRLADRLLKLTYLERLHIEGVPKHGVLKLVLFDSYQEIFIRLILDIDAVQEKQWEYGNQPDCLETLAEAIRVIRKPVTTHNLSRNFGRSTKTNELKAAIEHHVTRLMSRILHGFTASSGGKNKHIDNKGFKMAMERARDAVKVKTKIKYWEYLKKAHNNEDKALKVDGYKVFTFKKGIFQIDPKGKKRSISRAQFLYEIGASISDK